jgi:hypothetical protein
MAVCDKAEKGTVAVKTTLAMATIDVSFIFCFSVVDLHLYGRVRY